MIKKMMIIMMMKAINYKLKMNLKNFKIIKVKIKKILAANKKKMMMRRMKIMMTMTMMKTKMKIRMIN
jgi:hypothetical protein